MLPHLHGDITPLTLPWTAAGERLCFTLLQCTRLGMVMAESGPRFAVIRVQSNCRKCAKCLQILLMTLIILQCSRWFWVRPMPPKSYWRWSKSYNGNEPKTCLRTTRHTSHGRSHLCRLCAKYVQIICRLTCRLCADYVQIVCKLCR